MDSSSERPVRFYFSLRSPYSWLALHDLDVHHPELARRLEWRPFWEPDARSASALEEAGRTFPYSAMSRAKHLYVLQDVKRLATARGLSVAWPVDRDPVWEVPHLAYLAAAERGAGREFVRAASHARWIEGDDLCDPVVVARVGDRIGVDGAELAAASEEPRLRAAGVDRLTDVCDDGVVGVPYFVHRRSRHWGVDRIPDLVAELDGRSRTPEPDVVGPPVPVRGGDLGHAGGCG